MMMYAKMASCCGFLIRMQRIVAGKIVEPKETGVLVDKLLRQTIRSHAKSFPDRFQ